MAGTRSQAKAKEAEQAAQTRQPRARRKIAAAQTNKTTARKPGQSPYAPINDEEESFVDASVSFDDEDNDNSNDAVEVEKPEPKKQNPKKRKRVESESEEESEDESEEESSEDKMEVVPKPTLSKKPVANKTSTPSRMSLTHLSGFVPAPSKTNMARVGVTLFRTGYALTDPSAKIDLLGGGLTFVVSAVQVGVLEFGVVRPVCWGFGKVKSMCSRKKSGTTASSTSTSTTSSATKDNKEKDTNLGKRKRK